jgi:hypothetical protein
VGEGVTGGAGATEVAVAVGATVVGEETAVAVGRVGGLVAVGATRA